MSRKKNAKHRRFPAPNPKTSKRAIPARQKKTKPTGKNSTRAKQSARRKNPAPPLDKESEVGTDGRNWYSDHERGLYLAALAANEGNVNKTAREQNIPEPTLRAWALGWRCPKALQLYEEKKKDLAKAAHEIAWKMAAEIPEDSATASYRDKVVTFGVMVDKMIILLGKPNVITQDQTQPSAAPEVGRIIEVVNGLPEHERATITRFLGLLQSGTLPAANDRTNGADSASVPNDERKQLPRAVPAFLT